MILVRELAPIFAAATGGAVGYFASGGYEIIGVVGAATCVIAEVAIAHTPWALDATMN